MMKDCRNCFYGSFSYEDRPCVSCTSFNKWIAKDTFLVLDNTKTKDVGVKYDNDKPQWSLVPFKAMTEVVDVLTYGAKKYAPDNWKKVPDARRRYIDAGFRHFTAYASGEKLDPETGKSHLAHAMCCMLFLLAFDKGEDRDQSDNDN
jgi:hypothetical protein